VRAEVRATSAEAIPVQSPESKGSGRRHLATDGKVGRSQQTHFAREFAQTELRDNGADPGFFESAFRAIHDRREGCGGLSWVCRDGYRSGKAESSDYLTSGGSQPRRVDFTRCSGIFRLRGQSSISEDSLDVAVPGKHVFTPDGAHRIGVDFAEDCQGSVETFLRIKRLIDSRYAGVAVGIRLDFGSNSVAILSDTNRMLVLYSSAESLRISDWIEIIHADDVRLCPNLRGVFAGL
jgi:hypothetical protein